MQVHTVVITGTSEYFAFTVHREDDGTLAAACGRPEGVLRAGGKDWNELIAEMTGAVATWETL